MFSVNVRAKSSCDILKSVGISREIWIFSAQYGLIGHLRADMDTDGNGFFSSWFDFREELKTDEFKAEFDEVQDGVSMRGNL